MLISPKVTLLVIDFFSCFGYLVGAPGTVNVNFVSRMPIKVTLLSVCVGAVKSVLLLAWFSVAYRVFDNHFKL